MHLPFLYHSQTKDGLLFNNDRLTLTLKTEDTDFDAIYVRHEPDNEEYLVEMKPSGRAGQLKLWQAEIEINHDRDVTHYLFKAIKGLSQIWLDAKGYHKRMPGKETHFKYNAEHQSPSWVKDQIFYQIFPDRFCATRTEQQLKEAYAKVYPEAIVKPWGGSVGTHSNTGAIEFFGGDLAGVNSKLDYLEDLGITAIYLNPIFASPSNHKYNTTDYMNIDPLLGTNEGFAQLCTNIRHKEMKVVLDAVFNHTSVYHPWFDQQGEQQGAYTGASSDYRDYYFFKGDSTEYVGWKGIASIPVLNFENDAVRDYIYQSDDAVIKHWLRPPYHVDGWRFDVIHMLGEGEGAKNNAHYVEAFRQAVKQENQDAYVLGEHFFEATRWLQGNQEDGAMNYYGFAHPVRALLAKKDIAYSPIDINGLDFKDWLDEARAKVPWQNQLSQMNQLDSHDTARFLTLLNGDEAKMKLALTLLMTYVGAPCIYYGSEVGLEGGNDPDNRRCFPWERVENSDWLGYYKQLIAMRKEHEALRSGCLQWLHVSEKVLTFARQLGDESIVIALNLDANKRVVELPLWQLGGEAVTLQPINSESELMEYEDNLRVNMMGRSASVWKLV